MKLLASVQAEDAAQAQIRRLQEKLDALTPEEEGGEEKEAEAVDMTYQNRRSSRRRQGLRGVVNSVVGGTARQPELQLLTQQLISQKAALEEQVCYMNVT